MLPNVNYLQRIALSMYSTGLVPDKRRRILLEVVPVRRGHLGFWEFGGGRVRGRVRKGRSVYKQPETEVDGSCHS
jgi:hypothetical protein